MDRIEFLKNSIIQVFDKYADYPHMPEGVKYEKIIDEKNLRFQLIRHGWTKGKQVYAVIFHVDIIRDKIWIHQDNTEVAIANLLVEKGVEKKEIVLGYFSENRRKYSEFAIA